MVRLDRAAAVPHFEGTDASHPGRRLLLVVFPIGVFQRSFRFRQIKRIKRLMVLQKRNRWKSVLSCDDRCG